MSRIDELVATHCPDGVEFREIQEIFNLRGGYTPSKNDPSAWVDGTVPWFRMEDLRENGGVLDQSMQHINETAVKGGRLFPANSILVATSATIGEHALITVPHLSNQRFTSLSLKPEFTDRFDIKFVYFYCFVLDDWCRSNTTTSSFASVDMAGFKRFKFPIPPVAIQSEIVSILDSMEHLKAELESELESELEYRSRQYAFYRDQLLTFGEAEGVRWATLGELYESSSGLSKSADQFGFGHPFLSFRDVFHNPVVPSTLSGLVNTTEAEQARYSIKAGDVFVTRTSEDLEGLGMSSAALTDYPKATFNGFTKRLRPKQMGVVEPSYAAYFFRSSLFRRQIARMAVLSTRVSLNDDILLRIRIAVPTVEEQQRVVAILDKFDKLVNDLSIGLPAEIAARRTQYEYYRDHLLAFEEAA